MKGITIYLEGGGETALGRATLRKGMNAFLSSLRDGRGVRKLHWNIIPCGSRNATFDAFMNGVKRAPDIFHVLLVDSEGPVNSDPITHLQHRDGWAFSGVDSDAVHLMVQTMETWVVGDEDALASVYGKNFASKSLPKARDLETVDKAIVAAALDAATKPTSRGRYHKINHVQDVLAALDPAKVRERCKHCERLFAVILHRIGTSA